MQAWSSVGNEHFLLDQWREQADVDEASSVLKIATENCRAAAVLIEFSGYGQTLARDLQRRFRSLKIHLIPTDRRSKTARLLRHIDAIQSGRIKLPQGADWREAWDSEFEQFPHGSFDDQVDALTQYLDFMAQSPTLSRPPARAMGSIVSKHGVLMDASDLARRGIRPGYATPGRQRRMTRIFPKREK
jgi:predicted phage terminase large subunit-like protein